MAARLRGLILPAVLTLAALAVLVSLGNWQVERLAWKEDLIARATERPAGPVAGFAGTRDVAEPRRGRERVPAVSSERPFHARGGGRGLHQPHRSEGRL